MTLVLKASQKKVFKITIAIALIFIILNPTFNDFKSYLRINTKNNFQSYSLQPLQPEPPSYHPPEPPSYQPPQPPEYSENYDKRFIETLKVADCFIFSIYKNGTNIYLGILKNFIRLR